VPMRSVPHRVLCLVGLDDGVFPRLGVVDGDDVLARDPMNGERDIRSEDRQLLLDAIGAHPILMNRPLVITPKGVRLCRPSEKVLDLLPPQRGQFIKEDGERVIDDAGRRVATA